MADEIRLDGKVAIVTGAGAGLGRAHALLLASRGAKVVVNDLGGAMDGNGASQTPAQKVVDEIKAAGGEAAADYNDVVNGDQIVKTALDAFGTVDLLINNAGIQHVAPIDEFPAGKWDAIIAINLSAVFHTTRLALPAMKILLCLISLTRQGISWGAINSRLKNVFQN